MSGVAPGSPVTASNSNQAWIDANGDDATIGRLGLQNTLAESGLAIDNTQRELNSIESFTGTPANSAKDVLPAWINNDVGLSSDDLKTRADGLTEKFNPTTGHTHTGAPGDAPQVSAPDLASVQLHGYFARGVDQTGISGSSMDVSSDFTLKTPSTNQLTKGVVVNAPENNVFLRQASGADTGDEFIDGSGNIVYGRITESSGVWTISFYVNLSGTETVYSFASPEDIAYYFQELFNPIVDAPVYSEIAKIPSENLVEDIPYATEAVAGKILLSNIIATAIAAAASKGTSSRASHEDHEHEGVHSIMIDGDVTQAFGDVEFTPGTGISLSWVGGKLKIEGTGAVVAYQETPTNPVNGTNDTFGPLLNTPASNDSVFVYVDGILRPNTEWSLVSNSVVFSSGNFPQTGQSVYFAYLGLGTLPTPPVVSGALKTEFRTVTGPEIAAKKLILAQIPASPGDVLVDWIGSTGQIFNVDYTIVSNELRWNGYALDGVIGSGDVLRVHYIY